MPLYHEPLAWAFTEPHIDPFDATIVDDLAGELLSRYAIPQVLQMYTLESGLGPYIVFQTIAYGNSEIAGVEHINPPEPSLKLFLESGEECIWGVRFPAGSRPEVSNVTQSLRIGGSVVEIAQQFLDIGQPSEKEKLVLRYAQDLGFRSLVMPDSDPDELPTIDERRATIAAAAAIRTLVSDKATVPIRIANYETTFDNMDTLELQSRCRVDCPETETNEVVPDIVFKYFDVETSRSYVYSHGKGKLQLAVCNLAPDDPSQITLATDAAAWETKGRIAFEMLKAKLMDTSLAGRLG